MNTYTIGFSITTDIEPERIRKFLEKLGEHEKTERQSLIKVEKWKPRGRPAEVQNQIEKVLKTATKPLSHRQLVKALDLQSKSVYYAMLRLLRKGTVKIVKDKQYNANRFYLTAREEELARSIAKVEARVKTEAGV